VAVTAAARPVIRTKTAWCYASGLVSALEGRLLSRRATLDLLAADSLDDLLVRIGQTLLLEAPPEAARPFDLAEALEAAFAAYVRQFARACPTSVVADIFLLPIEWRAFRAWVRAEALGQALARVPGAAVPDERWADCWASPDAEPPFDLFAQAAAAIRKAVPHDELSERHIDEITCAFEARDVMRAARAAASADVLCWATTWWRLGIALDLLRTREHGWSHERYEAALAAIGAEHCDIIHVALPEHPDWRTTFVRLGLPEVIGVPDEDGVRSAAIERLIDNAVTRLAHAGRSVAFGPEIVFSFLWGLRTEALNLRLIAAGLAAGLDADAIAGDIRDAYV